MQRNCFENVVLLIHPNIILSLENKSKKLFLSNFMVKQDLLFTFYDMDTLFQKPNDLRSFHPFVISDFILEKKRKRRDNHGVSSQKKLQEKRTNKLLI